MRLNLHLNSACALLWGWLRPAASIGLLQPLHQARWLHLRGGAVPADVRGGAVPADAAPGLPIKFLSIEGGIGAGKSTVLAALRQRLADVPGVVFIDEQVEQWEEAGLLQGMYDGRLSKAVFQQVALMCLAAGLFRALQTPGVQLIVSERSPYSNAIFAKVNLGALDLVAYELTLSQLLGAMPASMERHVVMLDAPVPLLSQRIAVRGRECEAGGGVDAQYMQLLADAHDAWFAEDTPTSKVRIDCSGSEAQVEATVAAHVRDITRGMALPL